MVVLILMVLIRKQNLWLWNKYPTGYRFKLQLNLRSDLDPSFNQIKPSIPFKHIFSCCFFLWMKSARGAVCYYEIFTLWNDSASQRCQHWHRFYVNKHSIRNETLLRLLWVFYSWIHIRSPFFLLSHSLSLSAGGAKSEFRAELTRTHHKHEIKVCVTVFLPLYFL